MSARFNLALPVDRPQPAAPAAPQRTNPELRPVRREGRAAVFARRAGWLAVFTIIVGLFGVAGFHAMIVQQQRQVDALNAELADVSARNSQLRVELTQLEAPTRILSVAQDELGMVYVEPADVVWLDAPIGSPPPAHTESSVPSQR